MNANIVRKSEQEITGIGAAIAAGLFVKYWSSLSDCENLISVEREFSPEIAEEERSKKLKRWA